MALVAGGGAPTAIKLGLSMAALQFAIGALNDIVDAPTDAARIPPKPIPSGAISVREARLVGAGAAVIGLALAATAGPAVVVIAVVVLGVGVTYDLFAKGTPWSWLPFAVGIPLLPVYGWVGVTGSLPGFFVALLPMAVLAGAALAIANARVDLEVDQAAGTRSVATALGADRAWWVGMVLMVAATLIGRLFIGEAAWPWPALILVIAGSALVGIGIAFGWHSGPNARRRAWEAAFMMGAEHSSTIGCPARWHVLRHLVNAGPDALTWNQCGALLRLYRLVAARERAAGAWGWR